MIPLPGMPRLRFSCCSDGVQGWIEDDLIYVSAGSLWVVLTEDIAVQSETR